MATEMSHSATSNGHGASNGHSKDDPHKKVSFSFPTDKDLSESARLLEHQALSPFSQHANRVSSEFQRPEEVSPAPEPMAPPQQKIMMQRPFDLMQPPSDVDAWPKTKMRIACTHCGHYVETILSNETEYMGYKSCFSSKPVFRQSFVHYCPNCNEAIGFHYTGEDCFCNHNKSTMTFDRVLAATCCAWGSD